jgi:hypothetical protein
MQLKASEKSVNAFIGAVLGRATTVAVSGFGIGEHAIKVENMINVTDVCCIVGIMFNLLLLTYVNDIAFNNNNVINLTRRTFDLT